MNKLTGVLNMRLFTRYKQNLQVDDDYIYSYGTKVARIYHTNRTIVTLGWWSMTTSKHINYVGREYDYKVQTSK